MGGLCKLTRPGGNLGICELIFTEDMPVYVLFIKGKSERSSLQSRLYW